MPPYESFTETAIVFNNPGPILAIHALFNPTMKG
jgi:hypothetical protein